MHGIASGLACRGVAQVYHGHEIASHQAVTSTRSAPFIGAQKRPTRSRLVWTTPVLSAPLCTM
jgi:hypothetical protein